MAIPSIFSPVQPQDFTLKPIQVHKRFVIQNSELYSGSVPYTGSGYRVLDGRYIGEKLKIGSNTIYPTNSFDNSYQHIIWKSVDAQYYRFPHDRFATFEHSNKRFSYKFLHYSASILAIPQQDFGEGIKPGSVQVTHSTYAYQIRDDGNGNLYDVAQDSNTSSFAPTKNLVAYWGFNDEFRKFKGTFGNINHGTIPFTSKTISPDVESIAYNVNIVSGAFSDSWSDTTAPIGLSAQFHNDSVTVPYILTQNFDDVNFTKDQDFTIAFWFKKEITDTSTTSSREIIIDKSGVSQKLVHGNLSKLNQNDLYVDTIHTSMSLQNQPTNVFPFRIGIQESINTPGESVIFFERSNGINTLYGESDAFIVPGVWSHVVLTKTGSQIILYENFDSVAIVSDTLNSHCVNDNVVMFGTRQLSDGVASIEDCQPFVGCLDEVRFYNCGLSQRQIESFFWPYGLLQTNVIGNVFYKQGLIVRTSPDNYYNKIFYNEDDPSGNNWVVKYQSTHTIYQYECLVRIKKGSFNLSQNPTAKQTPYTDLIINEMTSSLDQGGLFPYATSIGLYNDSGELMAVAKLNQPLQMREDVDITISIKFDG